MKLTADDLQTWVDQGVVSEEQAEAMAQGQGIDRSPRRSRPMALLAEGLGYLGAVLALGAAGAIVSTFWADLETLGQVALLGLVAGLLFVGGLVAGNSESPAMTRLGSLLWLLSVAAATAGLGLTVLEVVDIDEKVAYLVASVAATAYAGGLWLRRPRSLQQMGLAAGLSNLVCSLLVMPKHVPDAEWFGVVYAVLGVAWLALAWGKVVRPERTAIALGSVALLGGCQAITFATGSIGMAVGLLAAVALLAGGIVERRMVAVGFGAAGVLMFVPQVINQWFGDTLPGAMTLLVVGLVFLGSGLAIARTKAAR